MMRQFMYYVPASMRARLLARRHAQDEALGASPVRRSLPLPETPEHGGAVRMFSGGARQRPQVVRRIVSRNAASATSASRIRPSAV